MDVAGIYHGSDGDATRWLTSSGGSAVLSLAWSNHTELIMDLICEFFVSGDPKGQPRQRHFARNFGGKWMARSYDPGSADGWKGLIALAAKPYLPAEPLRDALIVDIEFFFRRPQRLMRKRDPDTTLPCTAKPDRDNLDKAVLDALTQCGFFSDDAIVVGGRISKLYCTKSGRPGAQIRISRYQAAGTAVNEPNLIEEF